MSALKEEGKPFLDEASIDLCSKLSLTYGGNVKHYKSVHHPRFTQPVVVGNTLAVSRTIQ